MKNQILKNTFNSIYSDYLAILTTGCNMEQRVKNLKQYSANIIGDYEGVNSPAHVTVKDNLGAKLPGIVEPQMLHYSKSLSKLESTYLDVIGFDYFTCPTGATIYLKIDLNEKNNLLVQKLLRIINHKTFKITPHIIITKNISYEKFKILWPYFKDLKVQENFLVDKVKMLKRPSFAKQGQYLTFKEFKLSQKIFENTTDITNAHEKHLKFHEQMSLF